MKQVKKVSIISFVFVALFGLAQLKPMESTPSLDFDLSGPLQLLESIKAFQAKEIQPKAIAQTLKACLIEANKNICDMRCYFPVQSEQISHANILYFLDETCNGDTVEIILSSIDTEEEACEFIMCCEDGPSGLERMLRKNYHECALPMVQLLWKHNVKFNVLKPRWRCCGFGIGSSMETIDICEMVNKAREKLESSTYWDNSFYQEYIFNHEWGVFRCSDETVLLQVFKELKTHLNNDPLNPEGWLGFFKL